MYTLDKTVFLKRTILANALLFALNGAVLFNNADWFIDTDAGQSVWVQTVGVILLIIALDFLLIARKQPISLPLAMAAVAVNTFGIILSIIVLMTWPEVFSWQGILQAYTAVLLLSAFTFLQIVGILRILRNERKGPRVAVEFQRFVDVSPALAWSIVSDVAGYSNHVPSIKTSRILQGYGKGMLRECSDLKDRHWTEQCTFWNEGEAYGFHVNTNDANYPYPFVELLAEWRVVPKDTGSLLHLRFEATMPWGILGELLLAIGMTKYNADVKGLLDNWEQAMLNSKAAQRDNTQTPLQVAQQL